MTSKIFGIGWAKTGTTTLGECFKILGFNHQGQNLHLVSDVRDGDLSRIIEIVKKKDTFEDWPWILLYKEFDQRFPGSKFILTRRDPAKWIKSYQNMLAGQGTAADSLNAIRRTLYGLPFPNVTEEQLIERYERHNREVEEYFAHRPHDLLVVSWEDGDGWEELCGFLKLDIPKTPFPHANRGRYPGGTFFNRLKSMLRSVAR